MSPPLVFFRWANRKREWDTPIPIVLLGIWRNSMAKACVEWSCELMLVRLYLNLFGYEQNSSEEKVSPANNERKTKLTPHRCSSPHETCQPVTGCWPVSRTCLQVTLGRPRTYRLPGPGLEAYRLRTYTLALMQEWRSPSTGRLTSSCPRANHEEVDLRLAPNEYSTFIIWIRRSV